MVNIMNNKKGFTLIEFLVTIAIISAISITIGISIVNMINNQKNKEQLQFKETLEKAACTYADVLGIDNTSDISTIPVCNLIKDGYLKKVNVPGKNYSLSETIDLNVDIEWVDNQRVCTFNYDFKTDPGTISESSCEDLISYTTIYSYRWMSVYGSSSTSINKIDSLVINEDYYTSYVSNLGENYVKYKVDNANRVREAYVCFRDSNKEYCLKGGDNGEAYSTNRGILLNNYFDVITCQDYDTYVRCTGWYGGSTHVEAYNNGVITSGIFNGPYGCGIEEDSTTGCGG